VKLVGIKVLQCVRFEVLTAACVKMAGFWAIALMMEAASNSETSANFYNPEDGHLL
jgi:hypothetical protein